jgi:hypothetical protein
MPRFYVGDVAYAICHVTNKSNRPHFVAVINGDQVGLCPLSHTPQGEYEITEMGGRTFVAAWDRIRSRTNVYWACPGENLRLRPGQLSDECIAAVMAEIRRQLGC